MEQNTQVVKLRNVDLSKVKTAFNRSLSISSTDALNFRITNTAISHTAEHSSKSLYKKWSLPITEACESVEGQFTELKVAIYAGNELVSKIFGFFGQLANLDFYHVNGSVTKIDLVKLDEKQRSALKITLVTASVASTFVELDADLIKNIFNQDESVAKFNLKPDDLKQLNKLATLSTNPETQTDYISIKTENGQLTATDGAFDIALYDTETVVEKIDIDKALFSCIEHENYEVNVYSLGESSMAILESSDSDTSIAVVLLSDADDSTDWDDFNSDTNWD